MEKAHALEKGAFGLDLEGGGKEMIDAPMLKQVCLKSFRGYSNQLTVPGRDTGREDYSDRESCRDRDTYC